MTSPNRRRASLFQSCFPAAAAAALVVACTEKGPPPAPPVPEVTTVDVIQRDVPIGAELTATLHGLEDVELRARVEGYLKSIDYAEGSEVKKGALLFTIDDKPYRAKLAESKGALARAKASLSKADLDVKRYRPLAAEKAISQAELDNAITAQQAAKAQVDAAAANAENAALDLGYTRITAPVAGLVGRAQRKVGDLVGKGEATLLTTLSSIDPVRVTVNMPEALYLRYAKRLQAAAAERKPAADSAPGAQLLLSDGSIYPEKGRLILIDRSVDSQTGTLRADLAFPNPTRILRPGLYAKVLYKEEVRVGALLVPQRAVQELQGQFTVVLVDAENKAQSRKVKTGPRVDNLWILEEGVKPGDKVIVEGAQKVRDGMLVKAEPAPPEPASPPPQAGPVPAAASIGAAASKAESSSR
ncbi:MAG: efflux RND transporter periplasmic adaptor subunit [Myxococcales bacterium]